MTVTAETHRGRVKDRDFTVVTDQHMDLADFVNQNSDLTPISPNHVKAVLALRSDFIGSPEQVAKRAKKAAERARYASLSGEQRKALKRAERAAAKAEEAKAEVNRLFSNA